MLRYVIPTHAIDVTAQSAKESTEENRPLRRDQLVQHTVVILVDTLKYVLEVVEEYDVVMLPERIEECFVPLVRRDVNQPPYFQFILAPFDEFRGFQSRLFVLKICVSGFIMRRPKNEKSSRHT
jgi:hypothetical protein